MGRRSFTEAEGKALAKKYLKDKTSSLRSLAAANGDCSITTVANELKRQGVVLRTRGGADRPSGKAPRAVKRVARRRK